MSKDEFDDMTLFEVLKWDFDNKEENVDLSDWIFRLDNMYPFSAIFERLKTFEKAIDKLNGKLNRLIEVLDNMGKIEVSLREWMKE